MSGKFSRDGWDEGPETIAGQYILESGEIDLVSLYAEPRLTRPAYAYPLDDPRHRCVQGLCDDHAGPPVRLGAHGR